MMISPATAAGVAGVSRQAIYAAADRGELKTYNIDGRIFLPVQDGTETYGGGLGLRELIKLDSSDVEFGPVSTVMEASLKAPASIHTLNRAGRLEVIDGLR